MWGLTLGEIDPKATADDSEQVSSELSNAKSASLKPPPYSPMIKSRICRGNYGFLVKTKYIPGVHVTEDFFFDPLTGNNLAVNQMSWQLKRVAISLHNL